jgi:transcriptional regulator with XRE-family HTH domain
MNIAGAQIRAARALLGWSTRDLAKRASLTVPVIVQIDSEGVPGLAAIQRALEAAGVVVFTNGD